MWIFLIRKTFSICEIINNAQAAAPPTTTLSQFVISLIVAAFKLICRTQKVEGS